MFTLYILCLVLFKICVITLSFPPKVIFIFVRQTRARKEFYYKGNCLHTLNTIYRMKVNEITRKCHSFFSIRSACTSLMRGQEGNERLRVERPSAIYCRLTRIIKQIGDLHLPEVLLLRMAMGSLSPHNCHDSFR